MPPPLPQSDLNEILTATAPLWPELKNQRLFLTGGTGFFGSWLVESFLHLNAALTLNARLTVLTRNPQAFLRKSPHLANHPALTLLQGDVRSFAFPRQDFSHILHAATEASARQLAEQPFEQFSTIVDGTRRVLEFASTCGARKLLSTSSGAVYGRQPDDIERIPETLSTAPDPLHPASVYGEAKRVSETLCALHARTSACEFKIARCFAFLGPHLPLDTHFAIGNFVGNALRAEPLHIASDGRAQRSYLYASDLTIWLWTMLFRAPSLRPYNVGSEQSHTIAELAQIVASTLAPTLSVEVALPPQPGPAHRYIPSTQRAQSELQLHQTVSLAEGLRRTAAWLRLESR